ncbi:ArsR/SmtB family transcription factor [Demequina gelatinilytica]|uniref:ArsR/SmtB family transcription factor n=1 Tax=Demequina gelatinilytica TaxID=1638980 RepID=UPI0007842D58|nr:helix-turn-helix domain-containing protein [Demequina gelatinilytica]
MATPESDQPAPWPVREITDPRELRALAHPLRFALLDLLCEGPLTASQCAERLGQTPANCSYHLRQLAKFGHVAPAEGGVGRERPWKARDEAISWDSSGEAGPAHELAAAALSQVIEDFRFEAWRAYRARRAYEPREWREADMSTDVVAWMSPSELVALKDAMVGLFAPYAERDDHPDARPADARAVRFFGYAYPGEAPGR